MTAYTSQERRDYFEDQVQRAWEKGQQTAIKDHEEHIRPIELVIYGVKQILNDVLKMTVTIHEVKINWWETIKRAPSNADPLTVLADLRWRYPLDFKRKNRDESIEFGGNQVCSCS